MNTIPKKIHYCWFGRKSKTNLMKKCLKSWVKYCPDYEIIEWNEDNFPIEANEFTKYTYENRNYAFLSDYVRLLVVQRFGGLYLDTDVELVKNLDEFLETQGFIGFENDNYLNTGQGFGAASNSVMISAMVMEYDLMIKSGEYKKRLIGCPILNTMAFEKMGLRKNGKQQRIEDFIVYPSSVMNPYNGVTGKLNISENTISIHWYAKSWMNKRTRLICFFSKPLHRIKEKRIFK